MRPGRIQRLKALTILDRAGGELPLEALQHLGGRRLLGADDGERAMIVRAGSDRARMTDVGLRALFRYESEDFRK